VTYGADAVVPPVYRLRRRGGRIAYSPAMLPIGDDDTRQGLPIANLVIIGINVLVFILLQLPSDAFTMGFSVIPRELTHGIDLVGPQQIALPDGTSAVIDEAPGPSPIWLTLFTSMFMHGGWAHLGGNMLFLFVFGDNVERLLGSLKYIAFYLVCGVVADWAQILSSPDSVIPSLGASGAISGVLAAYLVFFPNNPVRVLLTLGYFARVQQVPAVFMIGLWILIQFASGIGSIAVSEQTGGVAYWAHIGGFAAGFLLAFLLKSFVGSPPTRRYAV
jgi:membrane associated rhomboid family serine protease